MWEISRPHLPKFEITFSLVVSLFNYQITKLFGYNVINMQYPICMINIMQYAMQCISDDDSFLQ